MKGVFMPQKWKVLNSRYRSCMWIRTYIYIQSFTYFLISYSGDKIAMLFFYCGKRMCCEIWKWYFEIKEWWCSFLGEGFPRELSSMQCFIPINNISFHLCKRRAFPIPARMGEISFPDIEINDFSFHNQFWIFQSSQIIFIMSKKCIPSMGVIRCDLDTIILISFGCLYN